MPKPLPSSESIVAPRGKRNIDLHALERKMETSMDDEVYSYVVGTLELRDGVVVQTGSGPNFSGGVWTLCTCKHQMRSRKPVEEWEGRWVAGFSSVGLGSRRQNLLVFLVRVAAAHESHADLWRALSKRAKAAKVANENFLGDVFKPRGGASGDERFSFASYQPPTPGEHSHSPAVGKAEWKRDIDYTARGGRRPALLLGEPSSTFVWPTPSIAFKGTHARDYQRWPSLGELVHRLKPSKPDALTGRNPATSCPTQAVRCDPSPAG